MNFLKDTKKLIRKSKMSLDDIAKGARVQKPWLWRVATGRTKSPGVVLLQRVYDYLEKKNAM